MSTRIIINTIAFGLACISVLSFLTANADPVTPFIYGHGIPPANPNEAWEITPWSGNETPYVRVQTTIDNEIANGFSLTQLQSKYDSEALQSPQNPVAQFARAYCYEKSFFKYVPISAPIKEDILNNLERTDPHHIYEFTRERFIYTTIAEQNDGADLRYLDQIGRRLLAHSSNDSEVIRELYNSISGGKDRLQESLTLAQEMVRKYPNQPFAHGDLADAYGSEYDYSGNQTFCLQAIGEYETYLKMANPNDPTAKFVPYTIKALQGFMSGQYKWIAPK